MISKFFAAKGDLMRPLLMVHGISSNARKTYGVPRGMFGPHPQGLYSYLIKRGYQAGVDLFWYSYPTLNPIPISARRLRNEIERILNKSTYRDLDVLTFSLGGIIGKYYTISPLYQNEIHKLVMIAPPFFGSRWANWFRITFSRGENDLLFEGDGKALSPQILSYGNPFLRQLAQTPFPEKIETAIIALKAIPKQKDSLAYETLQWLINWTGEGDLVVPVESTRISVNHFYEISEELSLKAIHRYLPFNPRVQELVFQVLQ